jgi:hypothetical protein
VQLREHKSADKSQTLLHFLAATVCQSRPAAVDFADDLICVDKAGHVSLSALQIDLRQSRAALAAATQEIALNPQNAILRRYTAALAPELDRVEACVNEASRMYTRAARYFCEDEKTDPATFFAVFTRFAADFHAAIKDNRSRARKVITASISIFFNHSQAHPTHFVYRLQPRQWHPNRRLPRVMGEGCGAKWATELLKISSAR